MVARIGFHIRTVAHCTGHKWPLHPTSINGIFIKFIEFKS